MGTLLGKREQTLFDSINAEVYILAGTEDTFIWKWHDYIPASSGVSGSLDLLYGEPLVGSRHYTPHKIIAFFDRPTINADGTAEGLQKIKEGKLQISRKICERMKIPADGLGFHIRVGDIFEFFRHGNRFYFEVKNVEADGWINDQDVYTQYLADVVSINTFVPQRKLIGSEHG